MFVRAVSVPLLGGVNGGFMVPMQIIKVVGRLFMNPPGHRLATCLGKAALKTHALQTLRDCRASPNRAKRLECVRFIGAFRLARYEPVPVHGPYACAKTKGGFA